MTTRVLLVLSQHLKECSYLGFSYPTENVLSIARDLSGAVLVATDGTGTEFKVMQVYVGEPKNLNEFLPKSKDSITVREIDSLNDLFRKFTLKS